jgi:hypothetical protein
MKRLVSLLLVVALTQTTYADSHKVLVLQSEGRADARTRARINAGVIKLAKSGTDQASPGEITYSDAAAMVGCKPDEASCKDEVIGTLGVDEIVIVNVTPKPGGFEISVRRVAKGAASREAITFVSSDKPDKLDALAPLFGGKAAAPPVTTPSPVTEPTPAITTAPTIGPELPPTTPPPSTTTTTTPPPTTTSTEPAAVTPEPTQPTQPTAPLQRDDRTRGRHRMQVIGMASGGGMFVIGLVLWGKASGVQSDVDNARPRNKNELLQLQDLEAKGDSYARWGNVFGLGGLVLGGVSTYFYLRARHRHASTSTAWLGPAVFDHGAGVQLTIGTSP